ncbi:hypothetical protein ACF0H5_003368 [Mactra antiquata]
MNLLFHIEDAFFNYLNSDKWSSGCSIRVLEGQLLDQILLGLYRLERDGVVVRHATQAFARNNRKRTGCYKQATTEFLGSISETLLLEFAYFGTLTKETPNEKTLDPFEYLHQEQEKTEIPAEVQPSASTRLTTPSLPTIKGGNRKRATSLAINSNGSTIHKSMWGAHSAALSRHVQAINAIKVFHRNLTDKRKSNAGAIGRPSISSPPEKNSTISLSPLGSPESKRNSVTITTSTKNKKTALVPEKEARRHSVAASPFVYSTSLVKRTKPTLDSKDMSEADEDHSSSKSSKKNFIGRIYEIEFDDDESSDESDSNDEEGDTQCTKDKEEEFFGEEFYLSDKVDRNFKQVSTKTKLRRNKPNLQRKRKELQAAQTERKLTKATKKSILPPLPSLDRSEIDSKGIKHKTIDMPDEMPTFEEFIQLLKEDEYYDPRYKNRIRLKSRIIAFRYYMANVQHRSSICYSNRRIPPEIKNLVNRGSGRRENISMTPKRPSIESKKSNDNAQFLRLPVLQESHCRLDPGQDIAQCTETNDDLVYQSEEVKGVTDSESCKEHYLKHHRDSQTLEDITLSTKVSSNIRTQSIKDILICGSTLNSSKSPAVMFPKNSLCVDEPEERETDPEEEEEEESDNDSSDVFDTKKLNVRYSIERLRKKRRSRVRKKPAFIEILAKYYNVQNALRVFRKDSPDKDAKKQLGASILGKFKKKVIEKRPPTPPLGKLKHFKFLDTKSKKNLSLEYLSRADFSKPDLETFHTNLKKALDNFVVRREIVVSDIQTFYSATTSVTFTRKSCFQQQHTKCKQ